MKYWKRHINPLTNEITWYNEKLNQTAIIKNPDDGVIAEAKRINRQNNEGKKNMSKPWNEITKKSSKSSKKSKRPSSLVGDSSKKMSLFDPPSGISPTYEAISYEDAKSILQTALDRRIAAWQNSNKKTSDRVTDMTESVIRGFATSKTYDTQYEISLARYAVTKIVTEYGTFARDMKNVEQDPGKETIPTEFGKQAVVFGDVLSHLLIEVNGEKKNAMLQAVYIPCDRSYRVSIGGESNEAVKALENLYEQTIETNNFYQGKTLRFAADGVTFVQTPETLLEDAILPKKTL